MSTTHQRLVVCVLCLFLPSLGHAGPLRDALRNVAAQQAAATASHSRQRLWATGLVLTIAGGTLAIFGANQTKRVDQDTICGAIFVFDTCRVEDPNRALVGAGFAMVGAGVVMIILGRDKPAPQVVVTPSKMTVQHTVRF